MKRLWSCGVGGGIIVERLPQEIPETLSDCSPVQQIHIFYIACICLIDEKPIYGLLLLYTRQTVYSKC